MARSLRTTHLPPIPDGPIDGETLRRILLKWQTEVLAYMDVRTENQDPLYGRAVPIPNLMTYIGDTGQATSQRLLKQISAANKQSTQTAQPLTGADTGGGTASISIASHSVQYGFGQVAYNSGSITGLANSTKYYVYADDPAYSGGAVTYLATTNANNITANSDRYYVGSITTPAGGGGGTGGGWGGGGGGGGSQIP